jgi:hypothetical protein
MNEELYNSLLDTILQRQNFGIHRVYLFEVESLVGKVLQDQSWGNDRDDVSHPKNFHDRCLGIDHP